MGNKDEFEKIKIKNKNCANSPLKKSTKFYSEEKPTEDGNFWHYVDGVITEW